MTIPDETLMAFVDGELDAATRAQVESSLRENPELAQRVARHVALRQRLQTGYASELAEPMPQRLLDAARRKPAQENNVVSLQAARQARARDDARPKSLATGWRPAAAIAASLVIGFGLGYATLFQGRSEPPLARGADGALSAQGVLAKALSNQLAANQNPTSEIHIGVSFLAKNGDYCRTFSLTGPISPSGLACDHAGLWRIESLSQSSGEPARDYRTAASEWSPQTLRAVEERIDGETLDAAAEARALRNNWRK